MQLRGKLSIKCRSHWQAASLAVLLTVQTAQQQARRTWMMTGTQPASMTWPRRMPQPWPYGARQNLADDIRRSYCKVKPSRMTTWLLLLLPDSALP